MSNGHRNGTRARGLPRREQQPGSLIPVAPPTMAPRFGRSPEEVLAFGDSKPKAHPVVANYVKQLVTKCFVIDTNVLMHDPTALLRFEEHDVFIPMVVLEELDAHKTGMTELARNVRQVSRLFDELLAGFKEKPAGGIPLARIGGAQAGGKLFFQTEAFKDKLPETLPSSKADNEILRVALNLKKSHGLRPVILVSKDVNLRVKAHILGIPAEDYTSDRSVADADTLPSGMHELPAQFVSRTLSTLSSWKDGAVTCRLLPKTQAKGFEVGDFVYTDGGPRPFAAMIRERRDDGLVMRTVHDHQKAKHKVWGISARNREQSFALSLLLDPEVDLVTLLGQAGTGKTLLTLAAGLRQVIDLKLYEEIIVTRATVPLGEDIGFLPGDEQEKMGPWMGAIYDNLEVLHGAEVGGRSAGREHQSLDQLRLHVRVKSTSFMRGRTFLSKFVIIDEAQNLTAKQMKTLITRAGPGTKMVCLGNLAQIDTPYLTEGNSGLAYAVTRFRGWPHYGHIILSSVTRSRLAEYAVQVL